MDRARRRLASAIDGIRNLTTRTEIEVDEKISSEQCCLSSLVRHGFPDDPRCMAFDPVQRLLAIGAGHGCVRILGQAGVDYHLKHDSEEPVTHIQFLVNEGGLVTALRDDTIHLWNYRQKVPEIVHSLKMGKERLTCVHLPFQSKWLHVGTDKGNTYFVSLSTFELSTYVINWNKAIDLSCRTHPGAVRDLSLCPGDTSKLLIVFEKGHVVLWNIPTREAERFAIDHSPAKCVSWHYDGRQFMCGHKDGSLTIWNIRKPKEVVQKSTPHAPNDSVACRPITRLCWHSNAEGEQLIVFAGGMPADEGVLPALTVLRAKGSVTVLEMDHAVVEMCALNASPFTTTMQYPYAVAVLLKNDLLVVDMTSQGYPCLECPYPMDLHESPVTYLNYFSDCPVDLIAALTLVGRTQRRQGVRLSEKSWPITGGVGRDCATGHQEMLLTGHEDGSIKFWQASGEYLQIMYKLKTGRHFEKSSDSLHVSFAVTHVELCTESRLLLVAGACGQVSLFRFVKTESCQDVAVVLLHQLCSSTAPPPSPPLPNDDGATDSVNGGSRELKRTDRVTSRDSHSTDTSVGSNAAESLPIKVRGGALRRPAGYQPELVCQIPWIGGLVAEKITAIALNSAYGVIAVGTATGMALVDIVTSSMIYAWSNSELHGRDAIVFGVPSQNSDASPSEPLALKRSQLKTMGFSTMNPSPGHPHNRNTLGRLNTDVRQRSTERHRPVLSKAQSVAAAQEGPYEGSNGDLTVPETQQNGVGSSPTPSMTSLEKLSLEFVTSLAFISCPSKKGSAKSEPCLWLGMSTGACVAFNLFLPTDRIVNNVVVSPSDMIDGPKGTVVRLQERILYAAFLDRKFCLITAAAEPYKDPSKDSAPTSANIEKATENKVVTKASLSPTLSNATDNNGSTEQDFDQVAIFVSEREIRVISLPTYQQLFHQRPDIPLVKAKSSHIRGYPVLICLNAAAHIFVYSLPSLRPLFSSQLFRCSIDIDDPIRQKTDFSEHGLGVYMGTPSEVQKFTVNSELAAQVADCAGEIFVPRDTPEPPKTSFLRGMSSLFAGGQRETVDLDTIFSEKPSTTAVAGMKSVARTIPTNSSLSNMERTNAGSISAAQAATMAIQGLNERGERLNAVIDATENLRNNAMTMQSRSAKLLEKYEKKKWYQL